MDWLLPVEKLVTGLIHIQVEISWEEEKNKNKNQDKR
jgi:hypothetical protein